MKNLLALSFFLGLLLSCSSDDGSAPMAGGLTEAAAAPNTWVYLDRDDMFSRDGSTTGYLANVNPNSKKLFIYFMGGGACFNGWTCTNNANKFDNDDATALISNLNQSSVFNRDLTANSYQDWSYVFIPYSTGDVHSGQNPDADVPSGGPLNQRMQGYDNFTVVLGELFDYYGASGLDEILVTGSSAGGYGSYLNFVQVADRFSAVQVNCIIDAGPVLLNEDIFADCLADTWDNLFEFAYPSDYDSVVTASYDQRLQGVYEYLSKKYPNSNFGLMTDTKDAVIRVFFGFGANDCDNNTIVSTELAFANAMDEVRLHLEGFDNWNVYYVDNNQHTFWADRYLTTTVNGVVLEDWIDDVRAGTAVDVVP